ncbi:MAG: extracellular solute-binding protein [Aggregatilineales bacterium]
MRKSLFVLAVVALLAMSFVVSAQEDLSSVDPTGQTITYWHEWDGAQQEALDEIIDRFNSDNEWGITVEQVALGSTSSVRDQISAGITTGELPNLAGATFVNDAMGYFLDGVLVPLDPYYNDPTWGFSEEQVADLDQSLLDGNRPVFGPFNGELLAWPTGLSFNVMSVNMDMLNSLGFDAPPATLEEFAAVSCAAAELEGPNGEDVQGFPIRTSGTDLYSFIISNGGQIFDAEADAYDFTNDAFIEVGQFFQDLYNNGCAYVPDGSFVNTADFAFGLNPMAVGSTAGVPFINGDIESSGSGIENWVNTTVPWTEGNRTLQTSMRSLGVFVSTPAEQLATWLFIKHLASTESQVTWTELTQYQPYTQSGLEGLSEEFLAGAPQFNSIYEARISGEINLWNLPIHQRNFPASQTLDTFIANITVGEMDVMEAAQTAQDEANEIYQEDLESLE